MSTPKEIIEEVGRDMDGVEAVLVVRKIVDGDEFTIALDTSNITILDAVGILDFAKESLLRDN